MEMKRKVYNIRIWKNVYFSTYPPPTMIHLSHRVETRSIEVSFDCCIIQFGTTVSTSSSSGKLLSQGGFYRVKQIEVTRGQFRVVRRMFRKFPLQFLNSLLFLGLYGVWPCQDEAVPLSPVGLDVICELYPEVSTELHSTMQNSHFHLVSENGLTVLSENPKAR
jgi:hypothetical protein